MSPAQPHFPDCCLAGGLDGTARIASFGTTLLVPFCPEHNHNDMVDVAFWAFGLHTPIWHAAIPALGSERIRMNRDCPGHAAYTYTGGSIVEGHMTLACPEHTYALWDFSLGI